MIVGFEIFIVILREFFVVYFLVGEKYWIIVFWFMSDRKRDILYEIKI